MDIFLSINIWAVLVATIAAFVFGAVWYAPSVFGKIWQREAGLLNLVKKPGHTPVVYILTFLFSLIAALFFALALGPNPALKYALIAGLVVGFCWVSMSFGINYLFANRSIKLLMIDAGYHTLQFVLYGLILGLWHG